MCFNKEVSLIVFFFGMLASIKLFLEGSKKQDKKQDRYYAVAIFTLVVSLMQLNEFFIWTYQDTKSIYHQIASVGIYFTLFFQAIGLYLTVMYFNLAESDIEQFLFTLLFIIQSVGFLYGLYYIGYQRFGKLQTLPTDCTSRLAWDASKSYNKYHHKMYIVYMLSYFLLNFIATYYILKLPGLAISAFVLVSAMLYSLFRGCSYLQYGSLWCFIIVFLSASIFLFDSDLIDAIDN